MCAAGQGGGKGAIRAEGWAVIVRWIEGAGMMGDVMHVEHGRSRRRAVVVGSKPGSVLVRFAA